MDWIHLIFVVSVCGGAVMAQQGYDYNRPSKPFAPSTGKPGEATYPGSNGPTTQFPGTAGGYPSGKPGPGFPGSVPQGPQGPSYPGSQGSSYPSQGPSYPGQGPHGPSYPGQQPQGPTGQYPGSQGHHGPQIPGSSYPGSHGGHSGPSGPGDEGHYDESYDEGDYSAIPGQPETDYPIYSDIPETSFSCDQQQYPGYYADVETRCQVFHVCANDKKYDFLCPNGTIFHQEYLVCVWWNQFDCSSAESLYGINANIYDHSNIGQGPGAGPHGGPSGPQGSSGHEGSSPGYPGSGPQGPASGYPNSGGSHGPAPGYPSSGPGPVPSYPATGPQGPSPGYPGPGPQKPAPGYPGPSSQRPGTGYPGSGPQAPGTYPGQNAGPSPGYLSPDGSQQPTREYLPPVNG